MTPLDPLPDDRIAVLADEHRGLLAHSARAGLLDDARDRSAMAQEIQRYRSAARAHAEIATGDP